MRPEELKKWRVRQGHTQETLGKLLGVTNICVYRWEAGLRHIPPFLYLALESLEKKQRILGRKGKKKK